MDAPRSMPARFGVALRSATLLLVVLGFVAVLVPTVQAATLTEGYESFSAGSQPGTTADYTFSTSGSINALVTTAQAHAGTKSLKVQSLATGGPQVANTYTAAFGCGATSGSTPSAGSTFTFWTRIEALPDTGSSHVYEVQGNNGAWSAVRLNVLNTGFINIQGPVSSTSITTPYSMPVNTWVDFQMTAVCVASGSSVNNQKACVVSLTIGFNVCTATATATVPTGNLGRLRIAPDDATPFTQSIFIDDLAVVTANSAVTDYAAAATSASYVGMTAMEVSGDGQTVIIRTWNGASGTVKALNGLGSSLQEVGSVASSCNIVGGVDAYRSGNDVYTTYADCTSSNTQVNHLHIGNSALGTPSFACSTCSDDDVTNSVDVSIPTEMGDLGTIAGRPISFSSYSTSGTNHGTACWTFTSRTTNEIGLFCVVVNNSGTNDSDTIRRTTASGSTSTQDMCSFTNGGDDYTLGANGSGNTILWKVGTTVSGVGAEEPHNFMDQVFSAGSVYAPTASIACSNTERVAVATGSTVYVLDVIGNNPTEVITKTVSGNPGKGGLAMSGDGRFFTVLDGSTFYTYRINGTVGTQVASFAKPTGTVINTEMDYTGGNVWVAMDNGATDVVYRFAVAPSTCGTSCGSTTDDGGHSLPGLSSSTTSTSGSSVAGAGGLIVPGVALPTGWTASAFNGFLAMFLIAGVGAGCWGIFGRHPIALAIGAIMGFVLAAYFQLLELWSIIVIVVLAVAAIFLGVRNAVGGGK